MSDPFAVLGVSADATLDELRVARRRLAMQFHPDHGGDAAQMQLVNRAFDICVGHVTGRRPVEPAPSDGPAAGPATGPVAGPASGAPAGRNRRWPGTPRDRFGGVEHDAPSFTIDALPAEAFEALLVVATWIGEVLDDDPPYVLECHLFDPAPCWCRLEVVPDAGGSTVSLTVAPAAGVTPRVTAEQVRDVWVDQLNRLGQPPP